jgi:hypothetical protein
MDTPFTTQPNPGNLHGQEEHKKEDIFLSLGVFAATALMAWIGKWQTTQVIWALWICSLTVGYSWILVGIISSFFDPEEKYGLAAIPAAIFMLGFFTVHFGLFHLVHGVFLNSFFPLTDMDFGRLGPAIMIPVAGKALATGWPLVLGTFIVKWRSFPVSRSRKDPKTLFLQPYLNVIRMHILIFVFAGLKGLNLDHYSLIPVLAFYYFPWNILKK